MTDAELMRQFEACTLPYEHWTHRTHVKVAYLYAREYGFEESLERLRRGIKAYNAVIKVPESPTTGYNETITHAFLMLIHAAIQPSIHGKPPADAETFCDDNPHLLNKHLLRQYYSVERRMHPETKIRFIEPDLAPLPSARAL